MKNSLFCLLVPAASTEINCKVPQTNALRLDNHNAITSYDSNERTVHTSLEFKQRCSGLSSIDQIMRGTLLIYESVISLSIMSLQMLKGSPILKNSAESSMAMPCLASSSALQLPVCSGTHMCFHKWSQICMRKQFVA